MDKTQEANEIRCTYCGDWNIVLNRDHVIPVIFLGERKYDSDTQWIVPACKECNFLAGSSLFFSIPEKAEFLLQKYKNRYKKALETPFWIEEDIQALDYKLRMVIEGSLLVKNIVARRVAYLASISQLSKDYLRPKWVEEMYREFLRKRKKKKKQKLTDTKP